MWRRAMVKVNFERDFYDGEYYVGVTIPEIEFSALLTASEAEAALQYIRSGIVLRASMYIYATDKFILFTDEYITEIGIRGAESRQIFFGSDAAVESILLNVMNGCGEDSIEVDISEVVKI
jgi:hypothetical protein